MPLSLAMRLAPLGPLHPLQHPPRLPPRFRPCRSRLSQLPPQGLLLPPQLPPLRLRYFVPRRSHLAHPPLPSPWRHPRSRQSVAVARTPFVVPAPSVENPTPGYCNGASSDDDDDPVPADDDPLEGGNDFFSAAQ
jgi:hypothetical protein